jgi:hypothetical protein
MVILKRASLVAAVICCCALAGCFDYTEDPQGNLQSVGVPGVPLWQSKKPPAPITPTELGMTPEEASKMSGPVLVMPPDQSSKATRYRFYQTGQNNCQQDLAKALADRPSSATGDPPYCTETPTAPAAKGSAFIF